MNILETIIRRITHLIGWEIGNAIENVIWSVVIGIVVLCCACFGMVAVAWQIAFNR